MPSEADRQPVLTLCGGVWYECTPGGGVWGYASAVGLQVAHRVWGYGVEAVRRRMMMMMMMGGGDPALGPRSGNFCRFETLEGHFLVKIEMLAP